MFTIDEIRIEGEEDGFHLTVYTDGAIDGNLKNDLRTIREALDTSNSETLDALVRVVQEISSKKTHYRIGLPDQFHAEVERTIGRWLAEGEDARTPEPVADIFGDDLVGWLLEPRSADYDPDLARDIERGK